MEDRDQQSEEPSAHRGALRERMRGALAGVRRRGEASLREVRRHAVEATDRLKGSATVERLGSAVESWRVVKKAADAQQRGNHGMAYRLLEPEVRANPDDPRVVHAFWTAALACERPQDAVPAMQHIVRRLAASGKPDRAAELWLELRAAAPDARVDPGALVRIAPALAELATPEDVVAALRDAVHPDNTDLSPGLAVRVAELARERDPRTALCAAHRAIAAPDLDAAKRARLEGMVAELERAEAVARVTAAPAGEATDADPGPPSAAANATRAVAADATAAPPADPAGSPAAAARADDPAAPQAPAPPAADAAAPSPAPATRPAGGAKAAATEAAVAAALEAPGPAMRFVDIDVTEAMPTKLAEEGIGLLLRGGRKARVRYDAIKALAVAEVWGVDLHPVVVVDLALNWGEVDDPTLRVVRLRSDGFDPRMLMAEPAEDDDALRGFLAELLERSQAVPLPDPDGALGLRLRPFDDLEAYEREVLQVKS